MSDPRKNFVCNKCGAIINDRYRYWGTETPCPNCINREYYERGKELLRYENAK